jgi:hypothetical protein
MDDSLPTSRSQTVCLNDEKISKQPARTSPRLGDKGLLRLSTDWLFQSAKEIEIEHHGDLYRLRQTALGKLILTK